MKATYKRARQLAYKGTFDNADEIKQLNDHLFNEDYETKKSIKYNHYKHRRFLINRAELKDKLEGRNISFYRVARENYGEFSMCLASIVNAIIAYIIWHSGLFILTNTVKALICSGSVIGILPMGLVIFVSTYWIKNTFTTSHVRKLYKQIGDAE